MKYGDGDARYENFQKKAGEKRGLCKAFCKAHNQRLMVIVLAFVELSVSIGR
jgi:hypothetical protein